MAKREPGPKRPVKSGATRVKKDSASDGLRQQGDLAGHLAARVAEQAYALYEQRGRLDGHDVEDWLEAERRVLAEIARPR